MVTRSVRGLNSVNGAVEEKKLALLSVLADPGTSDTQRIAKVVHSHNNAHTTQLLVLLAM